MSRAERIEACEQNLAAFIARFRNYGYARSNGGRHPAGDPLRRARKILPPRYFVALMRARLCHMKKKGSLL